MNWHKITDNIAVEVTDEMLDAGHEECGAVTREKILRVYLAMRKKYMETHPGHGI